MHEMSIAVALVEQLEALAAEHGASRIEEVHLRAGAMRGIVPEALELAFEVAAEGSVAEGGRIVLEVVQPVARCRVCGARFEPQIDSFLCRECGEADVELIAGNDILITSVVAQQEDEPVQHG